MSDEDRPVHLAAASAPVDLLARRYQAVLARYFARRGIDAADAQDLAQEVFVRLSRPGVLSGVERADGYLFKTAANLANEYFRWNKVRRIGIGDELVAGFQVAESFPADRLLEGKEELDLIVAALNELPERMRNVFILARLENLPRAEIARRLGISKSLVEKHLSIATACIADRRRRIE